MDAVSLMQRYLARQHPNSNNPSGAQAQSHAKASDGHVENEGGGAHDDRGEAKTGAQALSDRVDEFVAGEAWQRLVHSAAR